jgi:hypothetical protein
VKLVNHLKVEGFLSNILKEGDEERRNEVDMPNFTKRISL